MYEKEERGAYTVYYPYLNNYYNYDIELRDYVDPLFADGTIESDVKFVCYLPNLGYVSAYERAIFLPDHILLSGVGGPDLREAVQYWKFLPQKFSVFL